VWVYGLDGEAPASLYGIDLKGNVALVLGGEGEGMRRLTREHCDGLVRILMPGSMESLNVSVAAGICLYATRAVRAEKPPKIDGKFDEELGNQLGVAPDH